MSSYPSHPHHPDQPCWARWPTLELPVVAPLWLDAPNTPPPVVPGRHRNSRWLRPLRPDEINVGAISRAGLRTPPQAHRARSDRR
ncbi:hypothetical protein ACQEVC_01940 [Plantactinospora sp. CA-294935]|uniref:hypothetical protein n=1 Tax=Plantactinospora sp. CA-294935 TaxID=3240012 RepID=UPI003D9272AF